MSAVGVMENFEIVSDSLFKIEYNLFIPPGPVLPPHRQNVGDITSLHTPHPSNYMQWVSVGWGYLGGIP